jgi:hypothetical protein
MEKLGQISVCGYDVLGYFMLDQETWKKGYYFPLPKLINETRPKHAGGRQALAMLDKEQLDKEQ